MDNSNKENKRNRNIIVILLIIILGLGGYIVFGNKTDEKMAIDSTQTEYVKPEEPYDRSTNVTLPGWKAFTIEANTKEISQGFEFHNPSANFWYEDVAYINGKKLEMLVVDSGNTAELNHYLKLANIQDTVDSVESYNKKLFEIAKNDNGDYTVKGIGCYKGKKKIIVKTSGGKKVAITMKGRTNRYYMTFGLYLSDNDELLYQSDLVSPGMYIQKMTMNRALKKGSYDAYVKIQPYKSDKKTKTNSGVVKITLNVQ